MKLKALCGPAGEVQLEAELRPRMCKFAHNHDSVMLCGLEARHLARCDPPRHLFGKGAFLSFKFFGGPAPPRGMSRAPLCPVLREAGAGVAIRNQRVHYAATPATKFAVAPVVGVSPSAR